MNGYGSLAVISNLQEEADENEENDDGEEEEASSNEKYEEASSLSKAATQYPSAASISASVKGLRGQIRGGQASLKTIFLWLELI